MLNEKIDLMKDELIKSTQEIIKRKSVEGTPKPGMPYGEDVNKALLYALETAEKLGLKTVNVDGYVGYAEIGDGDEYVAALGHLDVVPEGDGWKYPAYGGEIHDGKIFGRGALDDKGPIMACLYGLKAIKDSNLKLSKRIRVLFGTNEETGSKELEYYLEKEKAPVAAFTPDADFPIINGEKGITIFNLVKKLNGTMKGDLVIEEITGGTAANVVPDYAKAVVVAKDAASLIKATADYAKTSGYDLKASEKDGKVIVECIGLNAHGSTPELGKNAVMQLVIFLNTLELPQSEMADGIKFLAEKVALETDGKSFGVYLEDEVSGKLSFNLGKISADSTKIDVTLNLRYPVTKCLDDMMNPLNKTIEGTGFVVENFTHQEPLYFAADHPLVKTLQKVYTEQTGKEATLISIGGGTYAKEMPNTIAFGPVFPGTEAILHMPNEFMVVDDLIHVAKIYAHAMYELAK